MATHYVLATDLDGTFAGGEPAERLELQQRLARLPGGVLLYVTGRSVLATQRLMAEAPLPHPDLLIADVGTTVVRGSDFAPLARFEEVLGETWPGGAVVRERLAGHAGIREQEVRAPRRVSYWLGEGGHAEAVADAARRLDGLPVDLVVSADTYLDVLPGGVNKGTTLRRVLEHLGLDERHTVVAGDTLNDLALFQTGIRGVVVGNCEPALRERVCELEHLYMAAGAGAAGILEGLTHLGWFEGATHGE